MVNGIVTASIMELHTTIKIISTQIDHYIPSNDCYDNNSTHITDFDRLLWNQNPSPILPNNNKKHIATRSVWVNRLESGAAIVLSQM